MPNLPDGTVTFLFTDIQGSTRLWEQHSGAMSVALAQHDSLLRLTIEGHDGYVFKTVGDAFCAAFHTAPEALEAALDAQRALQAEAWPETGPLLVRMAVHTGAAEQRGGDYFGQPLNRVARLLGAGHGGQVLLSMATEELARDLLPDGMELLDLGEHRLKDLNRPERVFQMKVSDLPEEFPPLRTLDARPNNLPAQRTPLVGRDHEVQSARQILLRDDVRLLTLTGPGGTGKTRLGLQVAADLIDHFEDGVYFVSLATIGESALVANAIAQALGLQESSNQSLLEGLKSFLATRQVLLLLDNFEQVLEATPLVAELLTAAGRLKVLVTSRSVLHLYGEHGFQVPPLALPDPRKLPSLEALSQYAAVTLFIQRATAVKPDFAVTNENAAAVAEVCQRLDGLPLAIELAAARVTLLSPQAMLGRLDRRLKLLTGGSRDLPARQQTLRGAIAWGYDLLSDDEQALFRRLAVFAGGFTLEAAEAVCAAGAGDRGWELGDIDVFDGVASLVDKSLLRQEDADGDEPRFAMLGTIREYGLEQLEAQGEGPEIRQRHAEHYLALAQEVDAKIRGPEQRTMMRRLEGEYDNFRAALGWLKASGNVEDLQQLIVALWWYWYLTSRYSEGRSWLEGTVALAPPDERTSLAATMLWAAGGLAMLQSDYPTAEERLAASEAIFRELGEQKWLAHALTMRGQVAQFRGESDLAADLLERGQAIFRAVGDRWGLALNRFFRGNGAVVRAEHAVARAACEESLVLFRATGDNWGMALPLGILGRLELYEGDYAGARARFEEGLALRRGVGDRWGSAHLQNGLGDTARLEGDYEAAARHYEESLALFRESGGKDGMASVLHNLGYVALHRGDPKHARAHFFASLTLFRDLGTQRGVVECLVGLGVVAAQSGRAEQAARLFGAAEAALEALAAPLSESNVADYERGVAAARAGLSEAAFATAWAAGRGLSIAEAVAEEQAALAAV